MPRITEHYVTDPDLTDAVAQKAAPDPASLYTEASEQLEKALDTLDHQLGRLYIRLTPALTPYDPGSNEITAFTPAHEPDGQIVDQLTRTTNRIQTIIDTIHNIHAASHSPTPPNRPVQPLPPPRFCQCGRELVPVRERDGHDRHTGQQQHTTWLTCPRYGRSWRNLWTGLNNHDSINQENPLIRREYR